MQNLTKALYLLPRVKELIKKTGGFNGNQMECHAIQAMSLFYKPIDRLSEKELEYLQNDLILKFKTRGWVES